MFSVNCVTMYPVDHLTWSGARVEKAQPLRAMNIHS